MESINHLLKELEPFREASTQAACQGLLAALWRRHGAEIADLSIQFANADMANLAALCRSIASAKAQT